MDYETTSTKIWNNTTTLYRVLKGCNGYNSYYYSPYKLKSVTRCKQGGDTRPFNRNGRTRFN